MLVTYIQGEIEKTQNIGSRNSKTRNDFFVQVQNLYITFELMVST